MSEGFGGLLFASKRPCCRKECSACSPKDTQPHKPQLCAMSSYTTCQEIQLQPASTQDPTPSNRGALALEGASLGVEAAVDDFMALETESDETPWWLVRVVAVAAEVPNGYTCPSLGGDVSFEYPRNKMALLVRRLRPATTGRGADSTRHYSLDMTVEPFLVPYHLLRVGKIKLKEQAVALPRRSSRSTATNATTASSSRARFELKAEVKAQIDERCRCW